LEARERCLHMNPLGVIWPDALDRGGKVEEGRKQRRARGAVLRERRAPHALEDRIDVRRRGLAFDVSAAPARQLEQREGERRRRHRPFARRARRRAGLGLREVLAAPRIDRARSAPQDVVDARGREGGLRRRASIEQERQPQLGMRARERRVGGLRPAMTPPPRGWGTAA
jgi:hypothetical protein